MFKKELEELINKYGKENNSDTPDFIIAEFMAKCLEAFDKAVKKRSKWWGRNIPQK
jgi:hypothetical protein